MGRHGNCPVCGTELDDRAFCWRCGGEAEEAVVPVPKRQAHAVAVDRCQGRGESGRCKLLASSTFGGGGFCGCHFQLACYGWPRADYQEFERFMEREQDSETQFGTANPWLSWETSDWWEMVNGRDPKGKSIPKYEPLPDRRCTREENLAGLAACKAAVSGKKGPMAQALREALSDVPF